MILHMVSCLLLMTTLVHGGKYSEYINRQPAPPGYMYVAQNTDSAYDDYDDSDENDYFDDSEYGNAPFLEYANTDEYPSFREVKVNAHKGHKQKKHKHESSEEDRKEHKHHKNHNYRYLGPGEFYNADGIRYTSQSHKNGNLRLVSPNEKNLQYEQQIARNAEKYQQAREIVYLQNSDDRNSYILNSPIVNKVENTRNSQKNDNIGYLLNSGHTEQSQSNVYLQNAQNNKYAYVQSSPNIQPVNIHPDTYMQNSHEINRYPYLQNSPSLQQIHINRAEYVENPQTPHQVERTYLLQNAPKKLQEVHLQNSPTDQNIYLQNSPNVPNSYINTANYLQNSETPQQVDPSLFLRNSPNKQHQDVYLQSSQTWPKYHLNRAHSNGNMRSPLVSEESNHQSQCPCHRYIFDRRTGQSSCYCPNLKYVTRQAVVMVCPGQNTVCIPKQFCNNGVIDNNQYLKFKDTFSTDSCEALTHACCRVMSFLKTPSGGDDSNQIYNYIHNSNITNINNDITRYLHAGNTVPNNNPTLELREEDYEKTLLGHILRPLVSNVYKQPVHETIFTNTQFEPVTDENENISPHLNLGLTAEYISNIPSNFELNENTNNDRISIMTPKKLSVSTPTTESAMKYPYSISFMEESNYNTDTDPLNLGSNNPSVIGTDLSSLLMGNIGSNGQILNLAGTIQTSHPDSSEISDTDINVNYSGEMIAFGPKVVQPDSSSLKIDINGLTGMNQFEVSEPSITMTESGMEVAEVLMPTMNQGDVTESIMDYMDSIGTNTEGSTRSGNNYEHLNIYGLETIGYGIDTQSYPSSIKDFTGTKVDISNNSSLESDTVMGVKPNNTETSIKVDIDNISSKFNSKIKMDASKVEITNESELGLESPILENIKQSGKIGFGQPSMIGATNNVVQSSSSSKTLITGTGNSDVSLQITEGLGFTTGLQPSTITENQSVTAVEESTQTFQPMRNTEQSTTPSFEILSTTGSPSVLAQTSGADQQGLLSKQKVAVIQFEQSGEINSSLEGLRFNLPGMGKKQQSGIIGFGQPVAGLTNGLTKPQSLISGQEISKSTFESTKQIVSNVKPSTKITNGLDQIPGNFNSGQTIIKTVTTKLGSSGMEPMDEVTNAGPTLSPFDFGQSSITGFRNDEPQISENSGQTITKTIITTSGSRPGSDQTFDQLKASGFTYDVPHISENSDQSITKTIVTTSGLGQGFGQRETTLNQFDASRINNRPQISEDSSKTITKTTVTTSGSKLDSGQSGTFFNQFDNSGFVSGMPQMSEDSGQTITKTIITTSGSGPGSDQTFDQHKASGFVYGMPHISENSDQSITKTIVTTSELGQGLGQRETTLNQFDASRINNMPQMFEDSSKTITKTTVTTSGAKVDSGQSGTFVNQFDNFGFVNGMPQISEDSGQTITKTIVTTSGSRPSGTTFDQFDTSGFINGVPQMSENTGQTVTKTIFTTSDPGKGSRQNGTITRITTSESGQNGNGFGQFNNSGMRNAQQSGVFVQSGVIGSSNGLATFSGKSRQMIIPTDTTVNSAGSTNSVTNNIRQSGSVGFGLPGTTGSIVDLTQSSSSSGNTFGINGLAEINNNNNISVTENSNTLTQTMTTIFVSNGTTEGSESVVGDAFGYESSIVSAKSNQNQPAGQANMEKTEHLMENPIEDVLNGIPIAEIFGEVTPATNLEDQLKNNSDVADASTKVVKSSSTPIDDSDITVLLNNISKRVSNIRNLTITNATTSDIITYPTEDTLSVARMDSNINEQIGKPFLVNDALPTKDGEVIRTTLSNSLGNAASLINSEYTDNPNPTIKRHTSALHELARSLNINTGSIEVPIIDTQYSEVSKEPRTFEFFQNVLKRIGAATNIGHNNNYASSVLYNNGINAHNQEGEIYLPITGQTLIPVTYEHNEFQPIERQEDIIPPIPERIVSQAIEEPMGIQTIHKIEEIQTEPPKKTKLVMKCPDRMQCVQSHFCTAAGVITTSPVKLTVEQVNQLLNCGDEDIGIYGKCCHTPNE